MFDFHSLLIFAQKGMILIDLVLNYVDCWQTGLSKSYSSNWYARFCLDKIKKSNGVCKTRFCIWLNIFLQRFLTCNFPFCDFQEI